MDQFLETYILPRLMSQEERENLNGPIMGKGIKLIIKNFPTQKTPGPRGGFTDKVDQTFKEFMPILLTLSQKLKEEGTLSKSVCKTSITLIQSQTRALQEQNTRD